MSPPPLNQALGGIEVGMKSESSKRDVLAAAVLTPGILKHDEVVEINNLHVFLAHAHANGLKETAKQRRIRLSGELVSCSACSRAKGQRAATSH